MNAFQGVPEATFPASVQAPAAMVESDELMYQASIVVSLSTFPRAVDAKLQAGQVFTAGLPGVPGGATAPPDGV